MGGFDLFVRGGTLVTPTGLLKADLAAAGERVCALGEDLIGDSSELIDATGLYVFPGVIDAHVHFNDPGRAHWEGFETGSRAVAAGGGTLFFDMPLNAHPPTIDAPGFRLKLAEAEKQSAVDFAFWGGLVPQNADRLAELADCGVVGFKAFMADSGMDDFPCMDDKTLREGMKRAAEVKLLVAVHAESEAITQRLVQECLATNRTSVRDYLASRPVAAELDAIRRALDLAGETGCALHIVHVSCGEGVQLITEGRRRGVDVSCETCPHYLALTEGDVERLGAIAKCAPPLRSGKEREGLWQRLLAGDVTTVGSDHSPCPPDMKQHDNFFKVWGGISGAQHALPILLTEAHHNRRASLPLISSLVSGNVARRFKLPESKGRIAVDADADLALVDLGEDFDLRAEELFYRHAQTPYLGRRLRGRVVRTILRGRTVFSKGKIVALPRGRLIRPVI